MDSTSEPPRTYVIRKSYHLGFGFIAGDDFPTIVKAVERDGPSFGKLQQGDVIMAVNGRNVESFTRQQIIDFIQKCQEEIKITVRQPSYEEILRAKNLSDPKFYTLNNRQSSNTLMPIKTNQNNKPPANKSNKKSGDSNNDQPLLKRSNTMPHIKPSSKVMEIFEVVIRIFFEVGHTRVLNYNQDTTVGTILETLNSRLTSNTPYSNQIKKYFGLALTVGLNPEGGQKEPKRKLLHILDENDSIMKIRQLPYAPRLRLLYRMVYPPTDVSTLYSQDKIAFEYLYQQSCNDLKLERFTPELDPETALKLSALHLLEYVHSNHSKSHSNSKDPRVYIRLVKKTPGIEHFLPASMVESCQDKKGKGIISLSKKLKSRLTEQIRKNFEEFDFEPPKVKATTNLNCYSTTSFHELSLPEMQSSPSDFIKLLFLNYLSQLPCYGNLKRPMRSSVSPMDQNSAGDCSSSMESVPRASDSSPLIRQERPNQIAHSNNNARPENNTPGTMSRIAQMTPSIESISSITFNMQSSPSPQQTPSTISQQLDNYPAIANAKLSHEPSPMPRQIHMARAVDYHFIDKLYSQRYKYNERSIDELLRQIIPPPPPPSNTLFDIEPFRVSNRKIELQARQLTQVLTDKDIERLRVPPPPPRMLN